jgi:dihydrofolate reductase
MRPMFSWMMVTLDGYDQGPNRSFDFWTIDDEFNDLSVQQLDEADTLVFGRVTYEGMATYWPDAADRGADPRIAQRMNDTPKVVVSRTLAAAAWPSTQIVSTIDELAQLKQRPGQSLIVMGSSALTANLLRAGLIDEVRLLINPIILGRGRSAFRGTDPLRLSLHTTATLRSGNLLAVYRPT